MRSTRATSPPPPNRNRAGSGTHDLVRFGPAERLLTIGEVAYSLRVGRSTIYAMIRRGELPAVRLSSMLRVRPSDVQAYLRRHDRRRQRPRASKP